MVPRNINKLTSAQSPPPSKLKPISRQWKNAKRKNEKKKTKSQTHTDSLHPEASGKYRQKYVPHVNIKQILAMRYNSEI